MKRYPYILKKPQSSSYFFRTVIPKDLQPTLGKNEVQVSLKTGILRHALMLANQLKTQLDVIFYNIRYLNMKLTLDEVKSLLKKRLELAKYRIELKTVEKYQMSIHERDKHVWEINEIKKKIENNFLNQKDNKVEAFADKILKENEAELDKGSTEYKVFLKGVFQLVTKMADYEISLINGDIQDRWSIDEIMSESGQSTRPIKSSKPPIKLKETIDTFLKEREQSKDVNVRSLKEEIAVFALFNDIVGDICVHQLDSEKVRYFKNMYMALPPHLSKKKDYIGKSFEEIIKLDHEPRSPVTVANNFQKIRVFLEWFFDNDYSDSDLQSILKVKTKKGKKRKKGSTRTHFTEEDLTRIFNAGTYPETTLERNGQNNGNYWVPIIGVFTGARRNEICQLTLKDIQQADDVWIFNISEAWDEDERVDKSVKTAAGVRQLPIHQQIIDLGFLAYVEFIKKRNYTRIFPDFSYFEGYGYGKNFGKWFNKYIARIGVKPTDKKSLKKDFHSFRYTASNCLKQAGVEEAIANEIEGHEKSNTMSYSLYADAYNPKNLLDKGINKISYNTVDWDSLKKDWNSLL